MGNSVSHCEPEIVAASPAEAVKDAVEAVKDAVEDVKDAVVHAVEEATKEGGDEEEAEAEAAAAPVEVKVQTSPHDARFPATNQSRHCYTRYNEYYRCVAQKGEEDEECKFYQRAYRSICPSEWLEKWAEQREAGTYAGKY